METVEAKLSYWIAFIILFVIYNYWLIEKRKEKPVYGKQFVLRGIGALAHASLIFDVHNFLDWLPVLLFQVTSFFVIFSPALNIWRKKLYWYLGEDSGWIDRFYQDKPTEYKALYFICVALFVLSAIVLLNRPI